MAWPPTLAELRDDLTIPADEIEDDAALTRRLNAAVGFVQRVRKDAFLTSDPDAAGSTVLVTPVVYSERGESEAATLELGTLLLAARLDARRRSPDLVLFMAETGTTRVPAQDPEIARLLRIGRYARPRVG